MPSLIHKYERSFATRSGAGDNTNVNTNTNGAMDAGPVQEDWDSSSIASSRPDSESSSEPDALAVVPVRVKTEEEDTVEQQLWEPHHARAPDLPDEKPPRAAVAPQPAPSSDVPPAAAASANAAVMVRRPGAPGHAGDPGDARRYGDDRAAPPRPRGSLRASPPPAVDPTHARPSLNMTAHEFSEAKAIILDLLGWGVPAAYLTQYGLAREAIYYAFTELNLRLPNDFDTNGIVPYEPPPNYPAPEALR